jgi:predicted NBD/HSP70 family sugar kinase
MEPRKATFDQLRRHNRQLLLRAVYLGLADSRAALAQMTGLTKPTVSSLVAELIDDGLLAEGGQGPASESGGKRPRLLVFEADARQIIGLGVERRQVTGVLANLAGTVSAQHRAELDPANPLESLSGVVDGLRAQLDATLLCIGVGLPGEVDAGQGVVRRSRSLGWRDLAIARPLGDRYGVPVHAAHGAELSALAQYAFGQVEQGPGRLVTLRVDDGVELGVTLEGGAFHYGGDLAAMRLPTRQGGMSGISESFGVDGELRERMRSVGCVRQGETDYLTLRHAALQGDTAAADLVDEVAIRLAPLVAWALALLRPAHLSLAGPVTELGHGFLFRLRTAALEWIPEAELAAVGFSLAPSRQSGALGAVALALQKELAIV